jgi:hypothetical protein
MKNAQRPQPVEKSSNSRGNIETATSPPDLVESHSSSTAREELEVRPIGSTQTSRAPQASKWLFAGLLLCVVMPFLFWRMTWFGGRLSNEDMGRYLRDTSVPHRTQHALAQLSDRIARGDQGAKEWYPQLVSLAEASEPQFRLLSAWAMGQDSKSAEFHHVLQKLLQDPVPMVRWNAALALIRFGDFSGEPQIKFMLRPYPLLASSAGTLNFNLKEKDEVRSGGLVARIKTPKSDAVEVRSPLNGDLESELGPDGKVVQEGEPVATISPGEEQVWEALRALYLVGLPDDLPDVERFARERNGMPDRIRMQAQLTAKAIRQRSPAGRQESHHEANKP